MMNNDLTQSQSHGSVISLLTVVERVKELKCWTSARVWDPLLVFQFFKINLH